MAIQWSSQFQFRFAAARFERIKLSRREVKLSAFSTHTHMPPLVKMIMTCSAMLLLWFSCSLISLENTQTKQLPFADYIL